MYWNRESTINCRHGRRSKNSLAPNQLFMAWANMQRIVKPFAVSVFIVQLMCWIVWVTRQLSYLEKEADASGLATTPLTNQTKSLATLIATPTTSVGHIVVDAKQAENDAILLRNNKNNTATMVNKSIDPLWLSSRTQYHRWSDPNGISVTALLDRMKQLLLEANQTDKNLLKERRFGPIPAFVIMEETQGQRDNLIQQHEQYDVMLQRSSTTTTPILKLSWRIYYRRLKSVIHRRLQVVGPFVQDALTEWAQLNPNVSSSTFPTLHRLYQQQHYHHTNKRIILPMLWRMDDFRGCDFQNYHDASSGRNNNMSIPHFTLSASPSCPNFFCLPSYSTIELAASVERNGASWLEHFAQSDERYPWSQKLPLAVWRGSFTGASSKERQRRKQPRYQLAVMGKKYPHLLDVAVSYAATKVGGAKEKALRDQVRSYHLHNQDKLPYRLAEFYMNFSDFQRYRAVLDVDGNSWSERFPKLLCSNSVVIKIHPDQVDYFWPTLVPDYHFLSATLQNLSEVVAYAVADEHQEAMQAMVRRARQWCQTFMTRKHLQMDILSILNGFVEELDRNHPNWHHYLATKEFQELEGELSPFVPPTWQRRSELGIKGLYTAR